MVSVVKDLFHRDGLSLLQYLDNWLGNAQTKEGTHQRSQLLVQLCAHLGFQLNHDKLELVPTEVFHFVGMNFNLCLGMVFITKKSLSRVMAAARSLSQVNQAQARQWQSLIGKLKAQASLISLSQLKLVQFNFTFITTETRTEISRDRWSTILISSKTYCSGGQINKT